MSKKVKFEVDVNKQMGIARFELPNDAAQRLHTGRYRVTMKPVKEEVKEEPELKPCPFCGATGPDLSVFDKGYGYMVGCHKCGCEGPAAAWLQVAKAFWNQRE